MKKQLLLLAISGGAVAVSAPQVQAQVLPTVQFDPNSFKATGVTENPQVISVSGIIPEFIQFTSIDNQLELGNLGGPLSVGRVATSSTQDNGYVASQKGGSYNDSAGAAYVYPDALGLEANGNLTQTADGKAGVQFRSNAYIVLQSRVDRVRNVGPDGILGNGDDVVLTTGFQTRYRGTATRYNTATPISDGTTGLSNPTPGFVISSTSSASPTARGYNNYSNWKNVTTDNALFEQIIFKPGTLFTAPYDSNGYMFKARIARHGLNDYRGDYAGKINLTYYKF